MEFSKDELRELQEAVDRGKKKYEQRKKIEASLKKGEMREKRRALGIKVIKGGKSSQ